MAVNLIDSTDIQVVKSGTDISLDINNSVINDMIDAKTDTSVSTSSTNAVENQAITNYVNDIKDDVDKIGTQKQAFGDIFITDGTKPGTLYSHLVATYIGNKTWRIDYSGRLGDTTSSSNYYTYGLSITKIGTLLSLNLKSSVPAENIDNKSNIRIFNTSGGFDMVVIGYDTVMEYHGDLNRLMPARIYNQSGSIGGWPLNQFSNDCLMTGTLYLEEQ